MVIYYYFRGYSLLFLSLFYFAQESCFKFWFLSRRTLHSTKCNANEFSLWPSVTFPRKTWMPFTYLTGVPRARFPLIQLVSYRNYVVKSCHDYTLRRNTLSALDLDYVLKALECSVGRELHSDSVRWSDQWQGETTGAVQWNQRIRDYIGPLYSFPAATGRMVGLSPKVDRVLRFCEYKVHSEYVANEVVSVVTCKTRWHIGPG